MHPAGTKYPLAAQRTQAKRVCIHNLTPLDIENRTTLNHKKLCVKLNKKIREYYFVLASMKTQPQVLL